MSDRLSHPNDLAEYEDWLREERARPRRHMLGTLLVVILLVCLGLALLSHGLQRPADPYVQAPVSHSGKASPQYSTVPGKASIEPESGASNRLGRRPPHRSMSSLVTLAYPSTAVLSQIVSVW
jgi:hypothetical protein